MKTDTSSISRYFNIDVVLYLWLTVVCFLIAVSEFRSTAHFADLIYLNSTLAPEDSSNSELIDRYASIAEGIVSVNECRSDIVQAGLSFVMRNLDLQDATNNYNAWAAAMDRANRYVLHGLSCNAANGDMWVRLAMISQAVGESPQQLSILMNQSVLLSPSEMPAIRARFFVWKKATEATLSTSRDSVEHDIRTLLNYGRVLDIVGILGTMNVDRRSYTVGLPNSKLSSYIRSAIAVLPEERRKFLLAKAIVLPDAGSL